MRLQHIRSKIFQKIHTQILTTFFFIAIGVADPERFDAKHIFKNHTIFSLWNLNIQRPIGKIKLKNFPNNLLPILFILANLFLFLTCVIELDSERCWDYWGQIFSLDDVIRWTESSYHVWVLQDDDDLFYFTAEAFFANMTRWMSLK